MQGYTAIVIEPVGNSNQGQVKAMLMGSAVNQDGRSGGLTVGCKPKQSTVPMQRELLPQSEMLQPNLGLFCTYTQWANVSLDTLLKHVSHVALFYLQPMRKVC